MIERAEERGDLKPGMTIVESTTGNAGIACAAVAAIKGYDCVIVMPRGMSIERKRMIEAYGAELVLTPGAGTDIDLAIAKMREIVATDPERYFVPGEFENPDNPDAQTISGEEIWQQAAARSTRSSRPRGRVAGSPGSPARSSRTTGRSAPTRSNPPRAR